VASALDTQASLRGGVIRFTVAFGAVSLPYDRSLLLVVGDTRVRAATSLVNARVRAWAAAGPGRTGPFEEIGRIAAAAEAPLARGDWPELGRLMDDNHALLRGSGVSCPELEALVDAARAAGAYGAKLSGSGGGGIAVALADAGRAAAIAGAVRGAGALVYALPVGVRGTVEADPR